MLYVMRKDLERQFCELINQLYDGETLCGVKRQSALVLKVAYPYEFEDRFEAYINELIELGTLKCLSADKYEVSSESYIIQPAP